MMPGGFVKAKHQRAQIRQPQPMGDDPTQDAPLLEERIAHRRASLARDHEHHPMPRPLRAVQEGEERAVGLGLAHAVEVDHRIDRALAPLQPE
jgi:hypothetical protein